MISTTRKNWFGVVVVISGRVGELIKSFGFGVK
jgi:RNA polymerase subunit RPABC4/transcription elongation factor Spt4